MIYFLSYGVNLPEVESKNAHKYIICYERVILVERKKAERDSERWGPLNEDSLS